LLLTISDGYEEQTHEKFPSLSSGLYFAYIEPVPYKIFLFFKISINARLGISLAHPRIEVS
jgi:hypothetical protein